MNILLGFANAALQYVRGRQTGIVGLISIGIAILAFRFWDKILPFFDAIGLVDLYHHLGFGSDEYYMNFLHIFLFLLGLTGTFFVIGVILFGVFVGIMAVFHFLPDKVKSVLAVILLIPLLPFILILVLYMGLRLKLDKRYRLRFMAKHNIDEKKQKMTAQEALLKEHSTEISREDALSRLNRIPTRGDDLFLLGIDAENKLYGIIPKPAYLSVKVRPYHAENIEEYVAPDELLVFELNIKWYNEKFHRNQVYIEPKEFLILNEKGIYAKRKHINDILRFYQSEHPDIRREFYFYSQHTRHEEYINEVQLNYFYKKQKLLDSIKEAKDKETFDRLVSQVKKYNASNEDIVKIMFDNVRH